MIDWTYTPSSQEDEEEKAPDTVRDPELSPCEVCTYYEGYLTPCLGVNPDEEDDGK
jgi:hypothetical protein